MAVESWLRERHRYLYLLVIVLLVAAALRITGVVTISPPGLEHDEVAHWLINRDILDGDHALYFAEAYGHEAGFHYVQTPFVALLGDNILALRLPSVFAGLLLIAVCFSLARSLFDLRTALLAAALLAVLFWPIFYSRLALRAISLPVLSGASLYFWWRGWKAVLAENGSGSAAKRMSSSSYFIIGGVLAGLSLYTYMASRAVPIFYFLFAIYLLIFHREQLRSNWRAIGGFFIAMLLTAAPMAITLLSNPGIESRLSEVNQPLNLMLEGNFLPVLENGLKILGMFGIRGDPLWRQNIAFLPVFEPILAVFFYIGLGISLWRFKEPRYTLLSLWLFCSLLPSVVTIDAPSSIRMVNVLPIITIFPVIGLEVIHFLGRLSTVSSKLSTKLWRNVLVIALLILFLFYIGRSARGIYATWPANEEVRFVWQEALTDGAAYLDSSEESGPAVFGGWTPESMDPPTIELSLKREDLSIRYFDPSNSLILPEVGAGSSTRIIRPSILPLTPVIENLLLTSGVMPQDQGSFTLYEMPSNLEHMPQIGSEEYFGDELLFVGFDLDQPCRAGSTCQLLTYWQVLSPVSEPRSFFIHLVDNQSLIIAQDDALGPPSDQWQRGDRIFQLLTLDVPESGLPDALKLGVYNPANDQRLLLPDGSDSLPLAEWSDLAHE